MITWIVGVIFAVERMVRHSGPYLTRYYPLGWPSRWLGHTGLFPNVYVQHFHASDDRVPHNHPRWFLSLILRGGYIEVRRAGGAHIFRPGQWNYIPVSRYHYVRLLKLDCWTICLVGPTWWRKWGFWWGGHHVTSSDYKRDVLGVGARNRPLGQVRDIQQESGF